MAYLRDNDIEVANASYGFNTLSRGDGQGAIEQHSAAQDRRDGTLWTVAAGNEALIRSRLPKGSSTQRILDNDDGMPGLLVEHRMGREPGVRYRPMDVHRRRTRRWR